jgi:hypothetical protein
MSFRNQLISRLTRLTGLRGLAVLLAAAFVRGGARPPHLTIAFLINSRF